MRRDGLRQRLAHDLRWRVGLLVFAVLGAVGSACAAWALHDMRLRSAHAAQAPWHARVTALLPPELVGMLRLDRLLWIGCFRRLRRQTAACTLPDGVALTYLERGAYGTATAVVFVSLLLELPVHVLLTKADKLAYGAAKNALLKVRQEVHQGWGDVASLQLFSAPKRLGVEEAQQVLASWMGLLDEEDESNEESEEA